MKNIIRLFTVLGLFTVKTAFSADVTIYFSPSCPHCHHARDFINGQLVQDFPSVKITEVDVTKSENRDAFIAALKKCNYDRGGVPVMVIGEKCFQGYADSMQTELRDAVSIDLQVNKNADVTKNEVNATDVEADSNVGTESEQKVEKKDNAGMYFYGLLLVLFAGLTIIIVKKNKR